LHPYQKEIFDTICEHLDKERFIGQINMATGTGKSYAQIYLAIAALLTGSRRPIVIVTPYQQLVQQLYEDFKRVLQGLSELPISICQVLKVDSEESSITAKTLLQNRTLDGRPCVLLCCGASFRELQESQDEAMKPYQNPPPCYWWTNHICNVM
jgi:superfamily II DNA or RNA helicase